MFSKLKDKLKDWTKKIIEDKEEVIEKKIKKQLEEKLEKIQEEREQTEIKKAEEEQEEKKGFFKKLFSKEKVEEAPIEEKETIKETQKKKSFFEKILTGTIKISEEEFNNYSEELEMLLLENNVAFEVTEKVLGELKEKLVGKEIPRKELEQEIKNNLKEILKEILIEPFNIVEKIKEKSKRGEPYVILFCGINGTGKTTTIAKIAHMLKQEKLSCVIAAADTFRAAAIDQIKTLGERLDTKDFAHEYGSVAASVGYDAIKYAKKNNIPCVLIDTAGRIHTATNLLRGMEKIVKG